MYTLINDDFSGTIQNFISAGYLDGQLTRAQWYTYFTYNREPDVLTLNNAQSELIPGTLVSPMYDLPDGAEIEVSFDYKGEDVGLAQLVIGNGSYFPLQDLRIKDGQEFSPSDTWQTFNRTFEMEEGASIQLVLQLKEGSGDLFIDNLKVTVKLNKDEKVTVPYKNVKVENGESYYVETPDAVKGDMLSFRVTGYAKDQHNYYIYTPVSELMGVPVEYAYIVNVENTGSELTVIGNTISFESEFCVYNVNGSVIFNGRGSVTLPTGIYIVRNDKETVKIFVK